MVGRILNIDAYSMTISCKYFLHLCMYAYTQQYHNCVSQHSVPFDFKDTSTPSSLIMVASMTFDHLNQLNILCSAIDAEAYETLCSLTQSKSVLSVMPLQMVSATVLSRQL